MIERYIWTGVAMTVILLMLVWSKSARTVGPDGRMVLIIKAQGKEEWTVFKLAVVTYVVIIAAFIIYGVLG